MNERNQSIFLLSLFNGTEYIENRFLMDKESLFRIIQSMKLNKLKFVQMIRQMMVQDSSSLSVGELSEKYGIPLRAVSDILKEQEIFTLQKENSNLKQELQQIKQKSDNQQPKDQSPSFQNEQSMNHQQETKFQALQDNQPMKEAFHSLFKSEPEEFSQRTGQKLNEYERNILTVNKKPDNVKNEQQEQGKLNDQEIPSDKKQNSLKKKQVKVQSFNKLNKLQQSFDKNHNGDFICKQCQKIYTKQHLSTLKSKQVLYNHFYNKHAQKYKCNECNLTFKKLKILDKHFRNSHAQK